MLVQLVHASAGLPPAVCRPVPIYTPGWRNRGVNRSATRASTNLVKDMYNYVKKIKLDQ